MRTNVEKVLERDQKLSELDDRADALRQGASQFEQQAGKLKRKYWWQNLKVSLSIVKMIISKTFIILNLDDAHLGPNCACNFDHHYR